MKEFSYGVIKTNQMQSLGLRKKDRKERDDRLRQSMEEGWDVAGPRWRIGWGGLYGHKRRDDSERHR
jgi:hypothetical protein